MGVTPELFRDVPIQAEGIQAQRNKQTNRLKLFKREFVSGCQPLSKLLLATLSGKGGPAHRSRDTSKDPRDIPAANLSLAHLREYEQQTPAPKGSAFQLKKNQEERGGPCLQRPTYVESRQTFNWASELPGLNGCRGERKQQPNTGQGPPLCSRGAQAPRSSTDFSFSASPPYLRAQ